MRFRKQTPPELNGDHVDDTVETGSADVDALTLAEQAEAEAAEAEAIAAAARARARALRLRREAEAGKNGAAIKTNGAEKPDEDAIVGDDETAVVGDDETTDGQDENTDGERADDDVDTADDTVPATVEEPAKEKDGPQRRGIRIPLPTWKGVAGTLTVLIIGALLAGCAYMYWFHRQAQAEQDRRAEFEAAARQGVVTLMSLDYNHAKEDVQRIIDSSTGQFKTDFEATAEDFVRVANESKAVTETNVTSTAVESMTEDTATVIVAATSRVTNAAGANQEPRAWRLSVNLARDGGQLKLSKVEFVP
ncbi:hypothetical protein CQY20_02580 [Mycolicibacterium agri]|uniref:Membrane protein n=1 Tax=Mycolicibacterium agri TaxID=36811 RepID=A0A2A7NDW3_MYCAG|nr:hypothetical protein [Mycolicibacterium agri]PEG42312.1 hypothetical protein CQY20_02580 [Mycolicibacterium agri]GFG51164.1 membrane protein [Mycolicibacterium agri]